MSKNTSITLSPHFESFIAEQIKSGRYSSVSDVVRAGLRILENTETKLGTLRNMNEAGFFLSLWQAGLAEYDEMEGISWKWQSIDGTTVKAPLAQETVGRNPTDRGKKREQASFASRRPWCPAVPRRNRGEPAL